MAVIVINTVMIMDMALVMAIVITVIMMDMVIVKLSTPRCWLGLRAHDL